VHAPAVKVDIVIYLNWSMTLGYQFELRVCKLTSNKDLVYSILELSSRRLPAYSKSKKEQDSLRSGVKVVYRDSKTKTMAVLSSIKEHWTSLTETNKAFQVCVNFSESHGSDTLKIKDDCLAVA